jgi:hypothetical protein
MTDDSKGETAATPPKPLAGNPPQQPRIEVVFVPEPTDDMAELVDLEELIPDDGLTPEDAANDARQPRGGDFLGSTALIILLVVVSVVLVIVSFTSFGAQALGCEIGGCNTGVIRLGTQLVIFGLPLLTIATIVIAIVRLVRRKLAFPGVLIGIVGCVLLYLVASFLVVQSVPA